MLVVVAPARWVLPRTARAMTRYEAQSLARHSALGLLLKRWGWGRGGRGVGVDGGGWGWVGVGASLEGGG